jgi:hypothetical protein
MDTAVARLRPVPDDTSVPVEETEPVRLIPAIEPLLIGEAGSKSERVLVTKYQGPLKRSLGQIVGLTKSEPVPEPESIYVNVCRVSRRMTATEAFECALDISSVVDARIDDSFIQSLLKAQSDFCQWSPAAPTKGPLALDRSKMVFFDEVRHVGKENEQRLVVRVRAWSFNGTAWKPAPQPIRTWDFILNTGDRIIFLADHR